MNDALEKIYRHRKLCEEFSQKGRWMPSDGEECWATWGYKDDWYRFVIAGEFGFTMITDHWQRAPLIDFECIEFRPLEA